MPKLDQSIYEYNSTETLSLLVNNTEHLSKKLVAQKEEAVGGDFVHESRVHTDEEG